jgi:prepilin-type N-terminal cleavage/methylation domain-containing protein
MRRRRQERRGFTIVEVLMALVIFSMTAVVLGSAFVNVLNSYEIAKKSNGTDVDLNFARSQLLTIADLQTAENGQEFDDTPAEKGGPNRHVKWTADIEPTDTTDLFTVTFTCTIGDTTAAQPTKVVENFMLLRPTWSDPTTRSTLRQNAANRIAAAQGKAPK